MGGVVSTVGAVVLFLIEEFAETGAIAGSAAAVGAGELSVESAAAGALGDAIALAAEEEIVIFESTSAAVSGGTYGSLYSGSALTSGLDLLADTAIGESASTAALDSENALGAFFANQSINIGAATSVSIGSAIGLTAWIVANGYDYSLDQVDKLVPTIDQVGSGLFMNLYFRKKKKKRHASSEEGMLPKLYKRKKVQSY
nr:TPA: VP2 [Baja California bark scorpion polyomavirus 1]